MSVSGTNPNVLDLCRLCLVKDESLIPVFDSSQTNQLLCDKINLCLAVQISSEDRISQQICISCLFKIDSFYEFRVKSSESQQVLESWLQTSETTLQNDADLISKDINNGNDLVLFSNLSESNSCGDNESEGSDSSSSEDDSSSEESESADRENEPLYAELHPVSSNVVVSADAPGPSGLQAANNDNILPDVCSLTTDIFSIENKPKGLITIEGFGIIDTESDSFKLFNNKSKIFACELCSYSTNLKSNLKKHVMRHKKEYKLQCKSCGKGFYSASRFREHTIDGLCQQNCFLKCSQCSKRCRSITKLAEHIKTHDPGFTPPGYQCETCGKMFITRRGMTKHITVVHKGVRFKCHICDKELTTSKSLENHMKNHTEERTSFECSICGKSYITYKNLVDHEMSHTGESPYSCDICNKVFTQKAPLLVHRRYHTGERPFKCTFCDKAFVTKSILRSHEKIHNKT